MAVSVRGMATARTAESRGGGPMYLIRERFFRLGEDSDITDEHGRPVLHVDGKVLSLRKRLFTPFGDRFTIDVPGPDDMEMTGDLFDHEFTIRRGDQTVATISKQWFSMRDTYAVDVAAGQDDLLILASVLALDLAEDQERREH